VGPVLIRAAAAACTSLRWRSRDESSARLADMYQPRWRRTPARSHVVQSGLDVPRRLSMDIVAAQVILLDGFSLHFR
jgi:hypothetical protein